MGVRLDSPEEIITFPPIESILDDPEDKPTSGPLPVRYSRTVFLTITRT